MIWLFFISVFLIFVAIKRSSTFFLYTFLFCTWGVLNVLFYKDFCFYYFFLHRAVFKILFFFLRENIQNFQVGDLNVRRRGKQKLFHDGAMMMPSAAKSDTYKLFKLACFPIVQNHLQIDVFHLSIYRFLFICIYYMNNRKTSNDRNTKNLTWTRTGSTS